MFNDIWIDGCQQDDPFTLPSSAEADQPPYEDGRGRSGTITDAITDLPGDGETSQRSALENFDPFDFPPQLFSEPQHSISPDNSLNIDPASLTLNYQSFLPGSEDFGPFEIYSKQFSAAQPITYNQRRCRLSRLAINWKY